MNSENDAELLFLSLQFLYVMQVQNKLSLIAALHSRNQFCT
jgi:hypothetical protein